MNVNQDVGWFDIAVHDTLLMSIIQGGGDVFDQQGGIREGELAIWSFVQHVFKVASLQVAHDQENGLIILAEIMNGENMGMFQAGDDLCFLPET